MKNPKIKIDIQKAVKECRGIADSYIAKYKSFDSSWPTKNGCIYIRLSTDEQVLVEKGSLQQQIHLGFAEVEIRSRQDRINYKVTVVHIEPGISGQEYNRPEYLKLKRGVRVGQYQFVAFKEIARIARDSQMWQEFFKLCQEKNCKIIIRGLPIDPNDPGQILQLSIFAAFAEYEAQLTAKRIRESVRSAMIHDGKFNSTHQMLGLDPLTINGEKKSGFYQVNHDELATVEKIMRTFVKFKSHSKTLEYCDENKICGKDGKPFKRNALMNLLTNSRYIGKWYLNEANKGQDLSLLPVEKQYQEISLPHGEVIPIELWNSVQATLKETRHMGKNTKIRRVSPLSGLLQFTDGTKFRGFSGTSKTDNLHYYYRNDENGICIRAEMLEADATKTVASLIGRSPQLQKMIQTAQLETADNVQFLEQHLSQLIEAINQRKGEKSENKKTMTALLKGASAAQVMAIRAEFLGTIEKLNEEIVNLETNIEETTKQVEGLRETSFEWRSVADSAEKVQEIMLEKDPVALKAAYRSLFSKVIVGPEDSMGSRRVQYILKGNPDSNDEDGVCYTAEVVEAILGLQDHEITITFF